VVVQPKQLPSRARTPGVTTGHAVTTFSDDLPVRLWPADGTPGSVLTGHRSWAVGVPPRRPGCPIHSGLICMPQTRNAYLAGRHSYSAFSADSRGG
jgi:hypothetical protein